jgi:hypothetical protein
MFRRVWSTKQMPAATKPFSAFGADIRKQRRVIKLPTKRRGTAGTDTGDSQMRTLSFILAFALILAGPTMAGSSDNGLPGIGAFSYDGSPATTSVPKPTLVAAK